MKQRTLHVTISVIVSLALLVLIFRTINIGDITQLLQQSNKAYLVLALIVLFGAQICMTARWRVLLTMLGYTTSVRALLPIFLANLPVAKFTPGYTGDFMRAYYIRNKVPADKHAGGILLEAIIDIGVLGILTMLGSVLLGQMHFFIIGLIIVVLVILALLLLPKLGLGWFGRWEKHVHAFLQAFTDVRKQQRLFVWMILYTIIAWGIMMIYVWLLFQAFDTSVSLATISARQPIAILVSLIPITLWGIGARETVMVALYGSILPGASIVSAGLAYSLFGSIVLPLLMIPLTYQVIQRALHHE